MSNQLQTNLETILNEKTTKILPENIKKDVQIFDVVGSLEAGSGEIPIKLFSTIDEMNASVNNKVGDLALVDTIEKSTISTVPNTYSYLYLPTTITVTEEDAAILNPDANMQDGNAFIYVGNCNINGAEAIFLLSYIQSEKQYRFSLSANETCFKYVRPTTDTEFTTVAGEYTLVTPESGITNDYMMEAQLTKDTYDNLSFIKNLVFLKNTSNFSGVYIYSTQWSHLDNTMYSYANNLEKGKKAYAAYGMITGTLDLSAKYQPVYMNAYFSSTLCSAVDSGTPIDLSAVPDITYLYNKSKMPEIGNGRYFICYGVYSDPMMPEATVYSSGYYVTNNPDAKIIIERSSDNTKLESITSDTSDWTKYNDTALSHIVHNGGKDTFSLSDMKSSATAAQAEVEQENVKINIPNVSMTSGFKSLDIMTNCEVIDTTGKLVLPAGPKASTTLQGQCYTNITGDLIAGTYEPNYTELGTISPTEYNTAVSTTEDILGTVSE